jgi:hypothetical protein
LIANDNHSSTLPITPARSKSGVIKNLVKDSIGQRLAGELSGGKRGSHYLVAIHAILLLGQPKAHFTAHGFTVLASTGYRQHAILGNHHYLIVRQSLFLD